MNIVKETVKLMLFWEKKYWRNMSFSTILERNLLINSSQPLMKKGRSPKHG
jgi:hypothetical protein